MKAQEARSSGSAGRAALSPRQRQALDAVRAFAAEHVADFKVPRRVVIVEVIPKGPTGKLQRIGLAEKLGLA